MLSILITCRDPGPAEIAKSIFDMLSKNNNEYSVRLLAEYPATKYTGSGKNIYSLMSGEYRELHSYNLLKNKVNLNTIDLLIVSCSSLGVGIDEHLLEMLNCQSFMIQDFWGDYNSRLSKLPNIFLCLDEAAKKINCERYNSPSHVIGHLKYNRLKKVTITKPCKKKVIGYFDSPPGVHGSNLNLLDFYRALDGLDVNFFVRSHPKSERSPCSLIDQDDRRVDPGDHVYESIQKCDSFISPFSNACLDYLAYCQKYKSHFEVPVFFMSNTAIREYFTELSGFIEHPLVSGFFSHYISDIPSLNQYLKCGNIAKNLLSLDFKDSEISFLNLINSLSYNI
jgi:hypothetical protein